MLAPIFTGSPEVVAAEFADKVLARREKRGFVRIYSPFLAENVLVPVTEVALPPVPREEPPIVKKPRQRRKKKPTSTQTGAAA